MSDLNKELIEQLLQRIDLLEKAMKKHKKSKKADKDYDGDGEIESGTEEYMGSRDKAIKKAMGKKIEEALDRVGGNVNLNSPSIRSLASKIENNGMVEKVVNMLGENNNMKMNSFKDQGTKVQVSENVIFGGFPRILNEQGVVNQFNDSDDSSAKDEKVATKADDEPLWSDETLIHGGYRYPSKSLMTMAQAAQKLETEYKTTRRSIRGFENTPQGKELGQKAYQARMDFYKHPHYNEFTLGHPSKRNLPTISAQFGNVSPEDVGYGAPGSGSRYTGD